MYEPLVKSRTLTFGHYPCNKIEVLGFVSVVTVSESEASAEQTLAGLAKLFDSSPELIRDHPMTLVGTPEQIVALLEERRERHGLDPLMLASPSLATLEVFGKEILPRFQA